MSAEFYKLRAEHYEAEAAKLSEVNDVLREANDRLRNENARLRYIIRYVLAVLNLKQRGQLRWLVRKARGILKEAL